MRCLTLAEELMGRGCEVMFISADLPGSLHDWVRARSVQVWVLPKDIEGNGWKDDADATLDAMVNVAPQWDWLVVDHYQLDSRWEVAMRQVARRVMVVDDQADRAHECELLLDQNDFPDKEARYRDLVPRRCRQLLGPTFALMRPEFELARSAIGSRLQRSEGVHKVLVAFGGADVHNLTSVAIEALEGLGVSVDVVIGAGYRALDQIPHSPSIAVHMQTSNMAALMAKADLSIGGGGVMSWERCTLGLPALTVSLAPNQTPICRALALRGAAIFVGEAGRVGHRELREQMMALLADPKLVTRLSVAAASLVDGRGRTRVTQELVGTWT
jgi:UDP-2,4-diacetamido-2,4,6-trideoxy-beta-L-altropyranose hydrolase